MRSLARVVEVGPGVEFIKTGDLCSLPFNIACGRCRNCKEGKTGVCLNVNTDRVTAGVGPGSTVYVAGAGPVGLAAAASAFLLGAATLSSAISIPSGWPKPAALLRDHRRLSGSVKEQIAQIIGEPEVDSAVDAVGFEARGHEPGAAEAPATVLNTVMEVTRAGGKIGIPGLYVTGAPGGVDEAAKEGALTIGSASAGPGHMSS
jgi:threonine dehydrogenase-like Zn-dependent dehydrogenase